MSHMLLGGSPPMWTYSVRVVLTHLRLAASPLLRLCDHGVDARALTSKSLLCVVCELSRSRVCEVVYLRNCVRALNDRVLMRLCAVLEERECRVWCLHLGEVERVHFEG